MAVTFIGSGAVSTTNPANPSCNAEDILVMMCVGSVGTLSMPAGWVAYVNNVSFAAGTRFANMWWKRAETADSAATVTLTNAGTHTARILNARSDARGGFDWSAPVISSTNNGGPGTTVTCNAITTLTANTLVMPSFMSDNSSGTGTAFTNANLSAITNRFNNGNTGTLRSIKLDTGGFVGPGSTGNSTVTIPSSSWIGIHSAFTELPPRSSGALYLDPAVFSVPVRFWPRRRHAGRVHLPDLCLPQPQPYVV